MGNNTMLYLIGAALIGGIILFKWDDIKGMLGSTGTAVEEEEEVQDPTVLEGEPLPTVEDPNNCEQVDKMTYFKYYADRVAIEIDKYRGETLPRSAKLELYSRVLDSYRRDLNKMYNATGGCIITLEGRALSIFAKILIKAAERERVRIPGERLRQLRGTMDRYYFDRRQYLPEELKESRALRITENRIAGAY